MLPTHFAPGLTASLAGQTVSMLAVSNIPALWNIEGADPTAKHKMNKSAQETHISEVIFIISTHLSGPKPSIPS